MFNSIKNLFKKNDENNPRYRREFAARLNGRHIRYVSIRVDNEDVVIGHDGCLAIHNDEFILMSDGICKFRTKIDDLCASELMSLDGVILQGPDLENGGEERKVIAYYKYYR